MIAVAASDQIGAVLLGVATLLMAAWQIRKQKPVAENDPLAEFQQELSEELTRLRTEYTGMAGVVYKEALRDVKRWLDTKMHRY